MKKFSAFGFRVLGVTNPARLVLMLLSFSTFVGQVFGHELKYKFIKGQILKYQYDTKTDAYGIRKEDHFILEFRVDSLSATGAFITMTPTQHTFVKTDFSRPDHPNYNQQSFPETNNSQAEPINYADINKGIRFHLAENGLLSQFQGVHEIFNTIIADFQKKESIGNKPYISYHWLQLRYWDDYYKMLVGCFFPPLPRSRYDRAKEAIFNYSRESIRVKQSWGGSYPDSLTTELPFQKQIFLHLDSKVQGKTPSNFKILSWLTVAREWRHGIPVRLYLLICHLRV